MGKSVFGRMEKSHVLGWVVLVSDLCTCTSSDKDIIDGGLELPLWYSEVDYLFRAVVVCNVFTISYT